MMISRLLLITWLLPAMLLLMFGCSGSNPDPVSPGGNPVAPVAEGEKDSGRKLWGIWEIAFDVENLTADVITARNAQVHVDVTEMLLPPNCDDCLTINVKYFNSFTRILSVDVTLRNPSQIGGRDVRGILFTDDDGHELRNADDWTELWDVPGGEDINPFKAFAKSEANRIFSGGTIHTENYLIYIPVPPKFNSITFAVDASWPGNCREPYEITNFSHTPLLNMVGASATLQVDVRDWQGDVECVLLHAQDITGELATQLTHESDDRWSIELVNNNGAQPGDYMSRITALSPYPCENPLYDIVEIVVSGNPQYAVDVTPPHLNFSPRRCVVTGDYAYVAGGVNGLHIFDISDPTDPQWVNNVSSVNAYCVAVDGDYAYVTTTSYLHIIDISIPESAGVINSVHIPLISPVIDMAAKSGYVYLESYTTLSILDVDPPESAIVVQSVSLETQAGGLDVVGDYAYVTGHNYNPGLRIVDIVPPESAEVIQAVSIPELSINSAVAVDGGYAYIVDRGAGLGVIDVDPPEAAHPIQILDLPGEEYDVVVENEVACIAAHSEGLHVVDVSEPGAACLVNTVQVPINADRVSISGGYAFICDYYAGIVVVDIDPPQDACIVGEAYTPGNAYSVVVEEDLAFVCNVASNYVSNVGENLQIIDIQSSEAAYVMGYFGTMNAETGLALDGGYAYQGLSTGGFAVIDIQNPGQPHLVKIVETLGKSRGIDIEAGYAYVAGNMKGLHIVDIDPLESAHTVKTVKASDEAAYDVCVKGGYAFVAYDDVGLVIIDIDPPAEAKVVKVVENYYGILKVVVDEGYAYAAGGANGLLIIDIDPVESAYIYNEVYYPYGHTMDVAVAYGYAFVAIYDDGFRVIDIDPPDVAHTVVDIPTPGEAVGVEVAGGFAYVTDLTGGLRIIKLW